MFHFFLTLIRSRNAHEFKPMSKYIRLEIEFLENRIVPAVLTVTRLTDAGMMGELRGVIAGSAEGDIVRFDPALAGATINLNREIVVNHSLAIDGSIAGGNATITTNLNGRALKFVNDPIVAVNPMVATISNITFERCFGGAGVGRLRSDGGAIFVKGSLAAQNCVFENNFVGNAGIPNVIPAAPGNGGAIYVEPSSLSQTVTIIGCRFTLNDAGAGAGGAVYIGDDDVNPVGNPEMSISIRSSTFDRNNADISGGAICIAEDTSVFIVDNCGFDNNSAKVSGGAIQSDSESLTISSSSPTRNFINNRTPTGIGGGVHWSPTFTDAQVSASIRNVEFESNTALRGGAVAFEVELHQATCLIQENIVGCLFVGNSATGGDGDPQWGGGAVWIETATKNAQIAVLDVLNSTFLGNQAVADGGAISVTTTNSGTGTNSVNFTGLTVGGANRSTTGVGGGAFLATAETANIWNCIIAQNLAGGGKDVFGDVNSQGFNLIGETNGSTGWQSASSPEPDLVGTIAAPLNPGFNLLGLQNNGGPTRTLSLAANSVAVRAGDPALQTIGDGNDFRRRDQRGFLRVGNVNGDPKVTIGAFDPDVPRGNAANQAPAGQDRTVTMLHDRPYTLTQSDFGFSDPLDFPGDNFLGVNISSLPTAGTLFHNGSAMTAPDLISLGDIIWGGLVYMPGIGGVGMNYDSFDFQVQDDGGDADGGIDIDPTLNRITFDVTNTAPSITSDGSGNSASLSVAENQTAVTTVTSADPDGDPPTYSIIGGADAAKFAIDASTGVLTFVSAPDFENPTDADANNIYEVTVQVSDSNGGTDTQAIAVTLTDASGPALSFSLSGDLNSPVRYSDVFDLNGFSFDPDLDAMTISAISDSPLNVGNAVTTTLGGAGRPARDVLSSHLAI